MLERYEKRKFSATVDNLGLTVELIPGADGKGAIVKGFISAIDLHDDIVKKVDDQVISLKVFVVTIQRRIACIATWMGRGMF